MKTVARSSLPLLLTLILVGGALEIHRDDHGAALESDSAPVFSSARHHQDSAHLDAAELAQRSDCPACMLLKSPSRLTAPPGGASPNRLAAATPRMPAFRPLETSPLLHGSRAPPHS